ncbi:hypothetical protein ACIPRD_04715 [Streptomyces sp. NPDC090108]|uniref:hypothetical protein n=1 Tax=Streptomyces sp. NPDC090108 TaxID=3365947 RepID=UPI00381E2420
MGGETGTPSVPETDVRTCLRCGEALPERRIPRFFCSAWHASQAAFTALIGLFVAERFGLRIVRTVLRAVHLYGWVRSQSG